MDQMEKIDRAVAEHGAPTGVDFYGNDGLWDGEESAYDRAQVVSWFVENPEGAVRLLWEEDEEKDSDGLLFPAEKEVF